jgi:acid phosphatase
MKSLTILHCAVLIFAPIPPCAATAADGAGYGQPGLDSTLWAATAVEHDAVTLQVYNQAKLMLEMALRNPRWTAALEQNSGPYWALPPAVIMDIDETILDNSPFQARLVRKGIGYDPAMWDGWVTEAAAKPIAGAPEFVRFARERKVTVFYVTNRDSRQKAATKTNLVKAGFPLDDQPDTLYCRGDQPSWGPDKTTRRAAIAQHYRILLLIGDDFGDFAPGTHVPASERRELSKTYRERWGLKWIVLPNAMYGSWENALYLPAKVSGDRDKRRLKEEALRGIPAAPIAVTAGKQ